MSVPSVNKSSIKGREAIGSDISAKTLFAWLLPRPSTYRRSTGRTCRAGLKMMLDILFVRLKKDKEAVESNPPLAGQDWRSLARFDVLSSALDLSWSVIKVSDGSGSQTDRTRSSRVPGLKTCSISTLLPREKRTEVVVVGGIGVV